MISRTQASKDYEYMKEAAKVSLDIWNFLVGQSHIKDPKVLYYSLNFLKDVTTLMACIQKVDLTLKRLIMSGDLEFYFDIYQGENDIGYLSKGWEDPGVRVGDVLYVKLSDLPQLHEHIDNILDVCCTQGIVFYFKQVDEKVQLELWTPLYIDALTPRGLTDALTSLDACRKEVLKWCPFER